MRLFSILTLCSLFLTSCNDGYKFWNISKFNIVDTALKDNEEIKILYSSRGPDNNKDLEYYLQIVAVSQRTGDTVNILTPVDNGFSIDDKDKVFNFFNQNNIASKLILMDPEKLKDIDNVNEASKNVPKNITKVARDPEFDNIANNNYPTVIGSIGTTSN